MRNKSLYFITLLGILITTSLISSVTAADESLWVSGGDIKKHLMIANVQDYNSEKYCDVEEKYELFYTVTWPVKAFSYKLPVKTCWYKTNVGQVGMTGGRIYITSPTGENVIRTNEQTYNPFYPLSDTDKMAMTATNGTSFYRFLYLYDNFKSRLSLSTSSNVEMWNFNRQNPWRLNDASGNGLNINHIDRSANGQWLIVEGINGFMRINTQTKEVLTFEAPLYGYGYGTNPTYQLTISNSGRYAIISGGNINSRITNIYDLSSCQANPIQAFLPASGCGKRDLKKDSFPNLTTTQTLNRAIFSNDDTNITLDVPGGTPYNRYVITSPNAEAHYMDYLALGDSYSSGEGEYDGNTYYEPGTDGDGVNLSLWQTSVADFPYRSEKCHLSRRSYPYLLRDDANLIADQFHSVACSGSTINDLRNKNEGDGDKRYNGRFDQLKFIDTASQAQQIKNNAIKDFIPGRASQIEFVEKYKPKVVTIGVGGNDIDFSNKVKSCIVPLTCSWASDLRYSSAKQIQTELFNSLDEFYDQLFDASSATTFIVIGYPNVISENDESCAPNVLLNATERRYAKELVSYMNLTIQAVAAKHGFKYIDISNSLQGDRLCDESYDGKAVQGLTLGDDHAVPIVISTPLGLKTLYVGFGNESFHPTHIGHEMIASEISNVIGEGNIANYDPCPTKDYTLCFGDEWPFVPNIPSYFSEYGSTQVDYVTGATIFESTIGIDEKEAAQKGGALELMTPIDEASDQLKLAPNQNVSVTMYSAPRQLGNMKVDANGNVSGSITIPTDAEPGPHTLVINAKDSLYRDMTMYQQIFVYDSLDDFDGDGTLNTDEKCGMVDPINQDEDRDGIDDGCDGIISATPDTTAPTITAEFSTVPNAAGWYKDDVTITWKVSDDVDTELTAPEQTTADIEGEHTYTSSEVCDAAGNCATGTATIKLDKTAPVVTATHVNTPNQHGWLNQGTVINWEATDNLSSVSNPDATQATQEGEHVYESAIVCDAADNCARGSTTIKIDTIPPLVQNLTFTKNPKSVSEESTLIAFVVDGNSGTSQVEYFIADDPGSDNGATMTVNDTSTSTILGNDFGTGVYKLSVRAQDRAGNWSTTQSDYLVVYDATSGVRFRGARTLPLNSSDNQLPWSTSQTLYGGKFAFSVRYGEDGAITKQSDFQFAYKTGENCNKPSIARNCHNLELNASRIAWFTTGGTNQSYGVFKGDGVLSIDNVKQDVWFVVNGIDGERVSPVDTDLFTLTVYPASNPTPLYFVAPTALQRGDIKIWY